MSVSGRADQIQVAKVIGIPIYLHFSWLIIFGLIVWTLSTGYFPAKYPDLPASSYWAKGLVASLLFFVSILLHELGHAVVARLHGLRTRSITLFIFGGVAQLEKDPRDGRAEFWMAAAGPVVSLALAGFFYACANLPFVGPSAAAVAKYLALINLILAVFNLVPAFPMDGGRLLRGALWGPLGKARATRIASTAGTFFAFLLIFIGVFSLIRGDALGGLWYILIGWFIKDASTASYQQVRLDEALRGVTVRDAMVDTVVTVPSAGSVAEAARELFLRTGYGGYPVTRGDAVIGLLCLKDVLRLSAEEREATSVQGAMRPLTDAIVTEPDVPLPLAIARMAQAGTARLLVMHGDQLVGLLTMSGVIRRLKVREVLAT
ncbi:MAG: site-2 protease family protein [Planctomycetota bacterium]|nr:MAG: site-2 protease family protein [Planctomycetota bacterium]